MDFDLMIPIATCILAALFMWFFLSLVLKALRRQAFSKQYEIGKLPKSMVIKKTSNKYPNHYILKYPYWKVSKKDGTADLRVKYNHIIWQKSILWIESYELISPRPYDLITTVNLLRSHNINIDLCQEEQEKRNALIKNMTLFLMDKVYKSWSNIMQKRRLNLKSSVLTFSVAWDIPQN